MDRYGPKILVADSSIVSSLLLKVHGAGRKSIFISIYSNKNQNEKTLSEVTKWRTTKPRPLLWASKFLKELQIRRSSEWMERSYAWKEITPITHNVWWGRKQVFDSSSAQHAHRFLILLILHGLFDSFTLLVPIWLEHPLGLFLLPCSAQTSAPTKLP